MKVELEFSFGLHTCDTCQIFVCFFGPKSFLLSSVQCPRTSKIKLQSYHLSAALRGRSAVVFRGIVKRRVGIDPQLADNVFDVQVLLRRVPDDEACGMLTCAVWQCWLPTHPGTCNVRPEIAKCIIFYHDIIFFTDNSSLRLPIIQTCPLAIAIVNTSEGIRCGSCSCGCCSRSSCGGNGGGGGWDGWSSRGRCCRYCGLNKNNK